MSYNKNNKALMEKIVLIKKDDNINIIEIDDDINHIDNNEILNLINKNYRINTHLGAGGQATVSDIGNNLVVRISNITNNEESKEKNLIEFNKNNNKILSRLKGIKNGSTTPINTFIIVDKNKNFEIIEIFKKREKGNLEEARNRGEILPQIPLMEQLISALKNEHSAGIIHRDIKPGNILIDVNNKATFGDFGFATTTDSKNLISRGSPTYVAPESVKKNPIINQQNDIYSLGIVFLENFLKDYNYDFFEFIKPEFEKFCNNFKSELNNKDLKTKFITFTYNTNISEFIKEDIINLDNFLPKEILENKKNKDKIKKLKIKLVDLIKYMTTKNLNKRYTIFEVKKEFDEIKRFIKKNLKWENGNKISVEDFLFLNKKQQINEEVKNRELYRMRVYNKNTINAAYMRLKNSLELLSKKQNNQEPILWEKNNETLENLENGKLENILQNLSKEKPLSQEAIECFKYLNDCIDENGDIHILCTEFYDKFENLKNNNVEEYLKVANKLSQLRELKIAIKIKELKKHKNKNNQKIKKLKELRNNTKLVINVSKETKYSKIEEKLKKLDKEQISFNEYNYKDQKKIQEMDKNSDKDEDLSDRTKNKKIIKQDKAISEEEIENSKNKQLDGIKIDIKKDKKIKHKKHKENCNDNDDDIKEVKETNNINNNKNIIDVKQEIKPEKKSEIQNLVFETETKKTIENKQKEIEEVINNICNKEEKNPEILITNLLEKNNSEQKINIINKIFNKALENNCINVINILFTKKYLDLNSREFYIKCVNAILNDKNNNLELSDTLLNNIKNNNLLLYISIINNIFSVAYADNNREFINKLFSSNNIDNFINLSFIHQEFSMPILEPIDIICNSNLVEDENLVKNFVNFINHKNDLIIDEILDIFYKNNRLDTINKIFDTAIKNNCPNVINKILTNKNCKKFFNLKIKNEIKNNPELIYEMINTGKNKIAKIFIENSVEFKEVKSLSNEIEIKNKENFDILKRNIQKLITNRNQYNNNIKEFKENIKKLNKIKLKVKNRFISIFSSKKPKYNYINTEDFNKLNTLFNLISNESLNYKIN